MKILQTIAGFGAKSGGTSTCTYDLIKALVQNNTTVELLTPTVYNLSDKLMGEGEEWIKVVDNDYITPYGLSKNMKDFIVDSDYDLYHTNGLWMYCNHITCSCARKKNKPYIITPHGMLYPDALKRSYWKKWPLLKLYFEKDILEASCLHVTCKPELEYVRRFGYKGPVALIGNPANLPSYINELSGRNEDTPISTFGFLGRLHPIKKVENLIYGINKCTPESRRRIRLVIMGKGDNSYEQFLRHETQRLDLVKNVEFKGFVNGRDKFEQLSKLSALFVPSDFENFGMIVTEALACKTPVFASLGTPWEELNVRKCGWWMDRTPENIASVMMNVSSMSKEDIDAMGNSGQQLVFEKYEASKVAIKMKRLYEWIVYGGIKPEFVYE